MMEIAEQHNKSGRRRRWPWIILLVLILVVVFARLSLKTAIVHDWVRDQIVRTASTVIDARLEIGSVSGDLFKEILLTDLSVIREDTVLQVDTLYARYQAISYFQPEFQIDEVRIVRPSAHVIRTAEGEWNTPRLLDEDADADTPFMFNISRFILSEGEISGDIQGAGPDSVVAVRDLVIEGGFGYFGDTYSLDLRDLGFNIEQTRLNEPVSVRSSFQANDRAITLERLVIATGASMLESTAAFNVEDSSAAIGFTARPLFLGDLAAYAGGLPVEKNLQVDLNLSGNINAFNLILEAEADGLEGVKAGAGFSWDEQPVLESFVLYADALHLDSFFENSSYPALDNFALTGNGYLPFPDPRQARWNGEFIASNIVMDAYRLDWLEGGFSLDSDELNADFRTLRGRERADAMLRASSLWGGNPVFSLAAEGSNINPSYWLQNPEVEGVVHFNGELNGEGYFPGEQFWNYSLDLHETRISGFDIASASLNGSFNSRRATVRSTLRNQGGTIALEADIDDYATTAPRYRYDAVVQSLNLEGYMGVENFATSINGTVRGEGRYMSLDSLQLTSTIRIDSSIINSENVEELLAEVQISDNVVYLNNARLRSDIADGSFDARVRLSDLYDMENHLSLDMQIKDIRSMAPLLGLDSLEATGTISGVVNPAAEGDRLRFDGSVSLNNLIYNDLLTSERVSGEVYVDLHDHPAYRLDLMLDNPVINSVVLQDVRSSVRGGMEADSTWGDYQFIFRSANNSEIHSAGSYAIGENLIEVQTTDFRLISDLRILTLREPFGISVMDGSFRMDTLRIDSDDGASMEMAIPYADSLIQRGYLEGENLNMTVIQNTLLNEVWFEGILSGRIYLDRNGSVISSTGDFNIRDIAYRGLELDSLVVVYQLEGERLEGRLDLFDRNGQLAEGELNVPFKLGDPGSFDEAFFEETVDGYLRMNEVPMNSFAGFLEPIGVTDTDGLLQLEATLEGLAGQPEIEAAATLKEATLSGVAVDSLAASFSYSHTGRELAMNATVVSLRQRAAEVTAQIPLYVDLRNFTVDFPGENDRVRMDIVTNGFNMASLNDFVNRSRFREIRGTLDGTVTVAGLLGDLTTNGQLNFRNGAVRIVEAGVRVDNIQADFIFDENTVRLTQFSARNGNGTFRADGFMELDQLRPGAMEVNMNATNFRLANTSEYSAIINMDTRLRGTLFSPRLEGSMNFVSGFINLQNFGERSVETVDLNPEGEPENDYSVLYDSLSLDMDVSFNRRFFVRNRRFLDLEYELEGEVDLQKMAGSSIEFFGSLSAVEGYARPLGKRFQLEEGVLTFEGDPANPLLNIRHLFEPPQEDLGDVRIWYVIEGSVEDPRFLYESDPPMGLEDIISYTLFGRPFSSLSSWRQVVANSGSNTSPASVAMEVLLDRVETLATQRLGIDVVQIDNTGSGSNAGTSIKTGWYLNPKTFFAIQNDITGSGPETIFTLEYLLRRNLKLILTQGSDSQTGVDLRWKLDY